MPPSMPSPTIRIPIEPLTQAAFSQFGTVIQNPAHSTTPRDPPLETVPANQGCALKILDVTHPTDLYHLAPSKKPSRPITTMFVCSPRDLRPHEPSSSLPSSWGDIDLDNDDDDDDDITIRNPSASKRELFDVQILERHPFTTQTFIPLGLSPSQTPATQYIVIVAPTLPASASRRRTDRPPPYPTPTRPKRAKRSIRDIFARARPSPFTNESAPPRPAFSRLHHSQRPKGPGLPDLKNLRAFVADGSMAVTYGPGTWHAPMVVVGEQPIDFVVVQSSNGVGVEDCQEVELRAEEGERGGITVLVDSDRRGRVLGRELPGIVRAKL